MSSSAFNQSYGSTVDPARVIVIGACPACRIGILENEYSCMSIIFMLCCFPNGLGKRRRCNNCTAYFQ
uniref:Brain protein I3 n=1 Tax=Rhodnius prolixus TaxID=13249 RepID=A0A905QWD5_RHOPR